LRVRKYTRISTAFHFSITKMSVSTKNINLILACIASENDLEVDALTKQISHLWKPSSLWGSKAAKEEAEKLIKEGVITQDQIVSTGKNGKIKYDDVLKAAGKPVEKKKDLFPFVSKASRALAKEHKLLDTKKHFPKHLRSGKSHKDPSKKTRITLEDVRRVAGVSLNGKKLDFSSPAAKDLAEKHKISPDEIKNRSGKNGKIKMSDIEMYLQNKEENSDGESDSGESSDEE
jgi:pyruvate/2-oxoglutarate dehydrogenase complex dihydrolipoamide acyltransferase (E2) component